MPRRRLIFLIATALTLLSAGWAARSLLHRWETDQDYESAKTALELGRFREASELGLRLANSTRYRSPGLLIAGEAAARQGQAAEALALYRRVPFSEPASSDAKWLRDLIALRDPEAARFARASLLAQGEILLNLTPSLGEAESVYRRTLAIDSNSVVAHERLAFILGLQGRAREAAEHRVALLRLGQVLPIQLVLLALGETADENPETVSRFLDASPDDPAALRAAARIALQRERQDDVLRNVTAALRTEPDIAVAQAWLGRVLLRRQDNLGFARWLESLPSSTADSPEVWLVCAEHASAQNDPHGSIRCYAEAVRRDPNYLAAVTGLARSLQSANETDAAQRFRDRAKRLEQLATAARTHQISGSRSALLQAAEMAAELGLAWESWGWYDALNQHERFEGERKRAAESQYALARRDPLVRVLPSGRVADSFDWRRFPLPTSIARLDANQTGGAQASAGHANAGSANVHAAMNRSAASTSPTPKNGPSTVHADRADHASPTDTAFRFVAESPSKGIDFAFHNGHRSEVAGEYMYEFSGGAAAVLDYDLDGWPDLYLSQGTDWPPRENNFAHLDQLCRNTGEGRFVNVAELAGVRENRFSQGVAVADFDNDGFQDLYVGNIGANRLYRNNGDGTFTDVTTQAGVAGNEWTSSIAPADFNNDGLIDLYVGNYLQGEHLFDRPCLLPDGSTRLCTPHEFAAAQDRVYVNEGDGRFRDVTAECGVALPDGKTLGVVAADFDGSGRMSVFTANDAVPNFLFVNEGQADAPAEAKRAPGGSRM
ncbi:MAG: FG-GAP-like repeat-containing protein, partial [Planctomycetota bacterium]